MTVHLAVGDSLPELAIPRISRTTLALFAGASGDRNPVHIDTDWAVAAGHPDVFAHGMLSMAYLGRFLTGLFDQRDLVRWSARFVAMTPVNAQPTCRGSVRALESTPEGSRAVLDLTVQLADGTTTVVGEAVVRVDGGACPRVACAPAIPGGGNRWER